MLSVTVFLSICNYVGSGKEEWFYNLKAVIESTWLFGELKRSGIFSTRYVYGLIISDRNTHLHQ